MSAKVSARTVNKLIRQLRKQRLSQGFLFMINSASLPNHQCYLEFPDGSIVIAKANSSKSDFEIVEELDGFEMNKIRKHFKLS